MILLLFPIYLFGFKILFLEEGRGGMEEEGGGGGEGGEGRGGGGRRSWGEGRRRGREEKRALICLLFLWLFHTKWKKKMRGRGILGENNR